MALALAVATGAAAPAAAAVAVLPQRLIAEDSAPFEHGDGLHGEVVHITAIHGAHDPSRGSLDFEMRVPRPVPTQQELRSLEPPRRGFSLDMSALGRSSDEAVHVGLKVGSREPLSAVLRFGDSQEIHPVSFFLSPDRRLIRFHVENPRLSAATFTRLAAGMPGTERVETVFERPLEALSARLRLGRLTVTSAPGARVRVSIRRGRARVAVVRYRQTALNTTSKRLLHRFCATRHRYTIAIRARDRYGNRRAMTLRPGRSGGCARRPYPLVASRTVPAQRRDPSEAEVTDIAGLRAVQDPEHATMLFELRLAQPLAKRPKGTFEFWFGAYSATDKDDSLDTEVKLTRRGLTGGRDRSKRVAISRDRRVVRVRLRLAPRLLRTRTYTHVDADSVWYPPGGDARHGLRDEIETFFDLPLRTLSARLRAGRLTVTSAQGARVRVRVRRNGGQPVVISYRQRAADRFGGDPSRRTGRQTTLRHRFSCRTPGTRYAIRIRARDRYGHRRAARLHRRCG